MTGLEILGDVAYLEKGLDNGELLRPEPQVSTGKSKTQHPAINTGQENIKGMRSTK